MLKTWSFFLFFLLLFTLIACFSERKTPLEGALSRFTNDEIVTSNEWTALEEEILAKTALYTREGLIKNGEVDQEQLKKFIAEKFGEEIQIEDGSGSSTSNSTSNSTQKKPTYHAFIENSASMDGYVNGLSGFKNTVYHFLSDLKSPLRNITDSLKLYYINSQLIPFPDDVEDFIEKLDPASFRKRGGNRSQTDISNALTIIFEQGGEDVVNILVSDCVFSPGRNRNATDYLVNQSIGIKNAFEQKLSRTPDYSTMVFKLTSSFEGNYYDYENLAHQIKAKRPYYMWLMGPTTRVNHMLEKMDMSKLDGLEKQHLFSNRTLTPNYRILVNNRIGTFKPGRANPKQSIQEAKIESRGPNQGLFQVAIGIDLENSGLDKSYILNPNNYRINNDDFNIQIEAITQSDKNNSKILSDYSHYLLLRTDKIKAGEVQIELMRNLPDWVTASNSLNDKDQTGNELNKTYGIEYLVKGVENAYAAASKNFETYFEITISINK